MAVKDGDSPAQARIRLGIVYCREKQFQKSVEQLEPVLKEGIVKNPILFYLGLAYLNENKLANAFECWDKLEKACPDDERLQINIARLHYLLGKEHIENNRYEEAIFHWTKYMKKYTNDDNTQKNIAELHFRAGVESLMNEKNKDISNAQDNFNKSIKLNDSVPVYKYYSGLCELELGNYELAVQIFKQLEGKMEESRIKYHLGLSLLKAGNKEQALTIFKEILKTGIKNNYVRNVISVISNEHIKNGNVMEAISLLEAEYE